jgi:hypothetical protein
MAYNQEIADKVCERLAAGDSLRKACEAVGAKAPTILLWTNEHEAFAEQYARARQTGYALLADELIEIADNGLNDTYETENGPAVNQDVIARSRLRVDTRKWMLSKMLPKVYGEKLETTHKGSVGVTMQVTDSDEKL